MNERIVRFFTLYKCIFVL